MRPWSKVSNALALASQRERMLSGRPASQLEAHAELLAMDAAGMLASLSLTARAATLGWSRGKLRRFLDRVDEPKTDTSADQKRTGTPEESREDTPQREPETNRKRTENGPSRASPTREREGEGERTTGAPQRTRPAPKPKPKPRKPKSGYQEVIDTWTEQVEAAGFGSYPWVFAGRDHDGSKAKRWLKWPLEELRPAMAAYLRAVQAGTAWPAGDPPTTARFDAGLAKWLQQGRTQPAAESTTPKIDTSTPTLAGRWLDHDLTGQGWASVVETEIGDGLLPGEDIPERLSWLADAVTHPEVVWAELKHRRGQPLLALVER